jgi:NitT/TauT family transport system substrate-binding protein
VKSLTELQGKTIVLGSAGWSAICAPMFAQAGVDPATITYADAGNSWGQALQQGQGDAALSWEGLRAHWAGQGLDFDYLIAHFN